MRILRRNSGLARDSTARFGLAAVDSTAGAGFLARRPHGGQNPHHIGRTRRPHGNGHGEL